MITTTTPNIEGRSITQYLGVVSSEVIIGANVIKDIFAGLRDFFGGRSATYEKVLDEARRNAAHPCPMQAGPANPALLFKDSWQ